MYIHLPLLLQRKYITYSLTSQPVFVRACELKQPIFLVIALLIQSEQPAPSHKGKGLVWHTSCAVPQHSWEILQCINMQFTYLVLTHSINVIEVHTLSVLLIVYTDCSNYDVIIAKICLCLKKVFSDHFIRVRNSLKLMHAKSNCFKITKYSGHN